MTPSNCANCPRTTSPPATTLPLHTLPRPTWSEPSALTSASSTLLGGHEKLPLTISFALRLSGTVKSRFPLYNQQSGVTEYSLRASKLNLGVGTGSTPTVGITN